MRDKIINLIGLFAFAIVFATTINLSGKMWQRYAPIQNFIVIDEFKLVDSTDVQLGYTIRNNKYHYTGEYNYKYYCLDKNGNYQTSNKLQLSSKEINLSATHGEPKRIDFSFDYPETANGECKVETDIYINIGEYKRYYGQFINYFNITK